MRWLMYSAAREAEHERMSLNFLPPSATADPPFNVFTSDSETYRTPYCVEEEEEQWLHPWFRVNAATPPALALCPSLLKAFASEAASLPDLRQRDDTIAQPSDLASTFSRDSQLISDCQPQRPPSSLRNTP